MSWTVGICGIMAGSQIGMWLVLSDYPLSGFALCAVVGGCGGHYARCARKYAEAAR